MAKPTWATNDIPTAAQFNSWLTNINFARATGTQSVASSTTLVTASELVVAVEANAIYAVRAVIAYSGPSAGDIKVLFRTPTSGSFAGAGNCLVVGASSQQDSQILPYGGNASEVWGALGSGTQYGTVEGVLITAGTAGNFSVEFAQNTSNGSATSIQGNSHLHLTRVS